MSTTPQRVTPPTPTPPEPKPETTVFFKPCFGITVQRSTLCVSVSARPDTARPGPAPRG